MCHETMVCGQATALTFTGSIQIARGDCLTLYLDVKCDAPLQAVTLPPANGCAVRISRDYPVPDPRCTPGAVNPAVTVDVLRSSEFKTSCLRDKATSAHAKAATYDWYGEPHPNQQ